MADNAGRGDKHGHDIGVTGRVLLGLQRTDRVFRAVLADAYLFPNGKLGLRAHGCTANISVMTSPTVYDLLIDLVVPSVVGLGTLAVGLGSLVVARRSHKFSESLNADAKKAATVNERVLITESVTDWNRTRWAGPKESSVESDLATSRNRSLFAVRLSESTEPNSSVLQERLLQIDRIANPKDPIAYAYLAGGMSVLVDEIVARWLQNPKAAVIPRDSLAGIIAEWLEKSAKRGEAGWESFLEKAKQLEEDETKKKDKTRKSK